MNNRENNRVNAKKIAENVFLGSSDGLPALVGVKELVFIPRKNVRLFRLGALFLSNQRG